MAEKTEGALSAPDEPAVVETAEKSESEKQKIEGDEAAEESQTPEDDADAEGDEPEEKADAKAGDETDEEPEKKEETKNQRKKRLKRERYEQTQRELAAALKLLSDYDLAPESLSEKDPNTAENYDEAVAHNAAVRVLKSQRDLAKQKAAGDVEKARETAQKAAVEAWHERVATEAGHIKDYAQKVYAQDVPFTPDIREALFEMERGPELAYHLAVNRDELHRLHDLPPLKLGAQLARMEAGLSFPKPKTRSSAPPPIKPLKGAATAPDLDLDKASYQDYRRARGFD